MRCNHHEELEAKSSSIEIYPYEATIKTHDCDKSISLFTWNITHKDFITEYDHVESDVLEWDYRLPRIRQKLCECGADIICLQEIDKETFEGDIGSHLHQHHGYTVKCNHNNDGVIFSQAILFKSDKFECKYEDFRNRSTVLLLSNTLEVEQCDRCRHSSRACLHHSIFVATVHLESPRNGKDNSATRASQLRSILHKSLRKAVTDILQLDVNDARSYEEHIRDLRVIIAGDFNCGHNCEPSQMLLNPRNAFYPHAFAFKDAYHELLESQYEMFDCHGLPTSDSNVKIKHFPSYASMHNIYCIDMIMYAANNMTLKGVSHTLPDILKQQTQWTQQVPQRINEWFAKDKKTNKREQWNLADYSELLQLPNHDFPSDHLPLSAVFKLERTCICSSNGPCECSIERSAETAKTKSKKKSKKPKPAKSNRSRKKKARTSAWKFHEINSF